MSACSLSPIQVFFGNGAKVCESEECQRAFDGRARLVYETMEKVQNFFLKQFGFCGIDSAGSSYPFFIGWKEDNAQFACNHFGCRFKFNDKYLAPEVIVHEYVHAIIHHISHLGHQGEAGALNESCADIFGIAFKHFTQMSADWKMAHLRDLSQHADMRNFQQSKEDNGYVHHNSLIPSHAFYNITQSLGEASIQKVACIWFTTLKSADLSDRETFASFASKTLLTAYQLFPYASHVHAAVISGWMHAGVTVRVPRTLTLPLGYTFAENHKV